MFWSSAIKGAVVEGDQTDSRLIDLLRTSETFAETTAKASPFISRLLEAVDRVQPWYKRLEAEVGNTVFSSTLDKLVCCAPCAFDEVEEGSDRIHGLRQRIIFGVIDLVGAFVVFDPEVGYCRGMCNVAAFLLRLFDDPSVEQGVTQQRVFFVFVSLIRLFGMDAGFAPGVHAIRSCGNSRAKVCDHAQVFGRVLERALPDLAEHFREINLSVSTTVAPWLRTALTDFHVLSPDVVSRVWDVIFSRLRFGQEHAWHVVYKVLLVVFQRLSPMLLESGLEESLRVLWDLENQRPDVFGMCVSDLFGNWGVFDESMSPPSESAHLSTSEIS
jgi:hypothetical protein